MQLNVLDILSSQPPAEETTLLPEGKYGLVCTESVVKPSKNNFANEVLHTTWKVFYPPSHKDRKVKAFFNIKHDNPSVQQSGLISLAKCCQACGLPPSVEDITIDLLGKKAVGSVQIKGKSETYAYDSNVVRQWLKPTTQEAPTKPMPVPVMPAANLGGGGGDLDDIPF